MTATHDEPSRSRAYVPRPKRAERRQKSREAIMDAAFDAFTEHGNYEGANLREIASAADRSLGGIYAMFENKADLFAEMYKRYAIRRLEFMRQAAEGEWSTDTLVAFFARDYCDMSWLWLGGDLVNTVPDGDLLIYAAECEVRLIAIGMLGTLLVKGREAGALAAFDEHTVAGMLWDLHLSNLRRGLPAEATGSSLAARMKVYVAVVLAGFHVEPAPRV